MKQRSRGDFYILPHYKVMREDYLVVIQWQIKFAILILDTYLTSTGFVLLDIPFSLKASMVK